MWMLCYYFFFINIMLYIIILYFLFISINQMMLTLHAWLKMPPPSEDIAGLGEVLNDDCIMIISYLVSRDWNWCSFFCTTWTAIEFPCRPEKSCRPPSTNERMRIPSWSTPPVQFRQICGVGWTSFLVSEPLSQSFWQGHHHYRNHHNCYHKTIGIIL